jgi:hypothetical protein
VRIGVDGTHRKIVGGCDVHGFSLSCSAGQRLAGSARLAGSPEPAARWFIVPSAPG